ncbi:MAG: hypothetical protein HOQ35_14400 [Acidobacteriaceae bacterium]|nr:hypothetical protein [Acidobacteriaceae bacterium]
MGKILVARVDPHSVLRFDGIAKLISGHTNKVPVELTGLILIERLLQALP